MKNLLILTTLLLLTGCGNGSSLNTDPCDASYGFRTWALAVAENGVKSSVRAPRTAEFDDFRSSLIYFKPNVANKCRYQVSSGFSAQNAYGALLYTEYTAIVERKEGVWQTSRILFPAN